MDLNLLFGAIGAVAAVIAIIFGIPPFLQWWRGRKIPEPGGLFPGTTNFNVTSVNQQGGTTAGLVQEGASASTLDVGPGETPRSQVETPFRPTRRKVNLLDETINLRSGQYEECHKRLRTDTRITGTVAELEGQDFSFYVMNRRAFRQFREGERGEDLYSAIDVSADSFRRTIPSDDTWYFIVDAYHKQNDRNIRLRVDVVEP